jgi:hypothetical protein
MPEGTCRGGSQSRKTGLARGRRRAITEYFLGEYRTPRADDQPGPRPRAKSGKDIRDQLF